MKTSLTGFICNRNEKALKTGVYGSKKKRSLMKKKNDCMWREKKAVNRVRRMSKSNVRNTHF